MKSDTKVERKTVYRESWYEIKVVKSNKEMTPTWKWLLKKRDESTPKKLSKPKGINKIKNNSKKQVSTGLSTG